MQDPVEMQRTGTSADDYRRLILAPDRERFVAEYPLDIAPTTDDRPFFFHTTRLRNQFDVAFGRSMLFGNGLSALLTLMGISALLVLLFIVGPLLVSARPAPGWGRWLIYFGALGAGFMLLEVALLQRFVLLLGHPVYSLTVTLFSLLLGTGLGSFLSRRIAGGSREGQSRYGCWSRWPRGARERVRCCHSSSTSRSPGRSPCACWSPARCLCRPASCSEFRLPAGMRLVAARRTGDHSVGLGHERRVLRRRGDGCRLRRDELGIFLHFVDCGDSSTRGRVTLRD